MVYGVGEMVNFNTIRQKYYYKQYFKNYCTRRTKGIVDPFQTWNTLNYSSSRIKTDGLFSFKYGKVQARMKTVDEGFWPAFWMLPSEVHAMMVRLI